MSRALDTHHEDPNKPLALDANISEDRLKGIYTKLARCLLQLSHPTFLRIGSLAEIRPRSHQVAGRPITLNMSNMVQLSNIPKSIFPSKDTTYQTADEWYVAPAEMQMATLVFQHNDMILSKDTWSARSKHTRASLPMPDGSSCFRL